MAAVTAISFEADGVRIVKGRQGAGLFVPEHVLTIAESELDEFLQNDRSPSYLVAISPGDVLYETVTIPPVEPKLTPLLARNEAARMHPELQGFSCAVQVIGDIPLEGRTIRRVACCLVPNGDIQPILEPFIRNNKIVRTMVAAPFALVSLLRGLDEEENGTFLCVLDGGVTKTLFLAENSAVIFARSVASNDYGWDLFDRQNVTMTLDYCFQSLRMRPSRVIALNLVGEDDPEAPAPRLSPLPRLSGIQAAPDVLQRYLIPLALAAQPPQAASNLLPPEYTAQISQQGVLRYCTLACLAAAFVLLVLTGHRFTAYQSVQQELSELKRQEINLPAIHGAHQQARQQRDTDQPLITAMNGILTPPDIPRLLVAFDRVRKTGVTITTVTAARTKEAVTLNLTGTVSGDGFAAAQSQFEAFVAALQQLPGLAVTTRQMELTGKTFTVGATYKP